MLGSTTTAQARMPFTMYLASSPQAISQNVIDDMQYDPKQQLTYIEQGILVAGNKSSTCSRKSGTTPPKSYIGLAKDSDDDTQHDD